MIVSEDTVSKALAYLSVDPHPLALARKDMTDAENARERIFAETFLRAEGTIKERECRVEVDPQYRDAKEAEAISMLEHERHKARSRAAEMIIEVWRSENANARAAERVR